MALVLLIGVITFDVIRMIFVNTVKARNEMFSKKKTLYEMFSKKVRYTFAKTGKSVVHILENISFAGLKSKFPDTLKVPL